MVATIKTPKTKLQRVLEVSKVEDIVCQEEVVGVMPAYCGWFTEDGTFYGVKESAIHIAYELDLFEDGRVSIGDEMHHIMPDTIEGELADEWRPTKEQLIDYMKSNPNTIVIE